MEGWMDLLSLRTKLKSYHSRASSEPVVGPFYLRRPNDSNSHSESPIHLNSTSMGKQVTLQSGGKASQAGAQIPGGQRLLATPKRLAFNRRTVQRLQTGVAHASTIALCL